MDGIGCTHNPCSAYMHPHRQFFSPHKKKKTCLNSTYLSAQPWSNLTLLSSTPPPPPLTQLPSFYFHIPKYQAAEQQTLPVSPGPISVVLQHCYLPVMVGFSCLLCLWQHKLLLQLPPPPPLLLPAHRQLESREEMMRRRGRKGKSPCSSTTSKIKFCIGFWLMLCNNNVPSSVMCIIGIMRMRPKNDEGAFQMRSG